MSERVQIQKVNKSTTDTSVPNSSKLLDKNRKLLVSQPPLIQAKLAINQPGDVYEQEADRVAERVMRMPNSDLQRKCAKCNEDEEKVLQAKESPGRVPITQGQDVPPSIHEVLRSPGQPLDPATRAFMEPRFGHDFSNVRVHYSEIGEQSAKDVNAHAYTVGPNIVFGVGQYAPETQAGRRLLAHELTHVVQQSQGPIKSNVRIASASDPSEIEATQAASAVFSSAKNMLLPLTTTPCQLSRETKKSPAPSTIPSLPSNPHTVEELMGRVINGLDASTKRSLIGDPETTKTGFKTLVIAELTHLDSSGKVVDIEYRYATNNNWSNPNLRDVTASLGLDQIDEITPLSMVGEHHGESITVEITGPRVILTAMSVSRNVCKGCISDLTKYAENAGLEISGYKRGSISVVKFSPKSASTSSTSETGVKPGPTGPGNLKSVSSSIVKKVIIGATTAVMALSVPSEAEAASKAQTTSVAAKQPISGASVDTEKTASQTTPPTLTKPSIKPTETLTKSTSQTIPSTSSKPSIDRATDDREASITTTKPVSMSAPKVPSKLSKPASSKPKTVPMPESQLTPKTPLKDPKNLENLINFAYQNMKSRLENVRVENARNAALKDFMEARNDIFKDMWDSPGQGMNITFAFMSNPNPKFDQPSNIEYISMSRALGSRPKMAPVFLPLKKVQEMEERNMELMTRSIWIEPLHSRDEGKKDEKPKDIEAAPTFIKSIEAFRQNTVSLYKGDVLGYNLSSYELLKQSSSTVIGYLANFEGRKLQFSYSFYNELLTYFESQVRDNLTKELDRLNRKMEYDKGQLKTYLEEGLFRKTLLALRPGRDIPLNPKMFDATQVDLDSAKRDIPNGAYRHAKESLEKAEALLYEHEAWLIRYSTGHFPVWYKSIIE